MVATFPSRALLGGVVVGCVGFAMNSQGQAPGQWLPPIDHGDHPVGCAPEVSRFYPIHASLIPVGPYRGCVLVWGKGDDLQCFEASLSPPYGADVDVQWAIFDPRTTPPTIHKFAWRINVADAPAPPCATATTPPGWQGLFCSGHCWLPDGRLLVVGGDYWATSFVACGSNPTPSFAGSRLVAVFNPNQVDIAQPHQLTNGPGPGLPWTSLHSLPAPSDLRLAEARWYPAVTLMARANFGGDLGEDPTAHISVGGGVRTFTDGVAAPDPGDASYNTHELLRWELFTGTLIRDPRFGSTPTPTAGLFIGPTTPSAGGVSFLYYPRVHFVSKRPGSPDGRLWMGGMAAQSADADVINLPEVWNNAGATLSLGAGNTLLEESSTVLFPPVTPGSRDLQLVMGGSKQNTSHSPTATVTNECFLMTTRNAPPSWLPFPPMIYARKFANAVLLPDASILVVGGGTGIGHGVPGGGQTKAEVFYNGAWARTGGDQATERTYHSVAVLLDDGRVLSAGGDTCADNAEYEIFEPHYLSGAPLRPTFVGSPPTTLGYGQSIELGYTAPFGQSVDRVVLLRPGSVTHGNDPGQRYEPLDYSQLTEGPGYDTMRVFGPADATTFPPGYAMMFLISSAGVPSVAHWVQVL